MSKAIFKTKLVNDMLYSRNNEEVEVLQMIDSMFCEIKFKSDNEVTTVYNTEVQYID